MNNKTNYEYLLSDLSSFTKKYINLLNENHLIELEKLLDIDDTNLYNFYNGLKTEVNFERNYINLLFKNFDYSKK